MMLRRVGLLVALSVLVGGTALAAKPAKPSKPADETPPNPSDLPWSLRDHYTITTADGGKFMTYAGDNGQWSLDVKGIGTVLEKVRSSIALADGAVIDLSNLGIGAKTRNKNTAELGQGTKYTVTLKGPSELEIVHSVTYYEQHPFYVVRVELANKGSQPIEVGKISPIVIQPGGLMNLSAETTQSPRRLSMVGPSPVLDLLGAPLSMIFHDPVKNLTLAVGSLPVGKATTAVNLKQFDGKWQGDVSSTFDPPVRLEPGATLSSDPVWISFTVPAPADVDMYYAWAQANMPNARSPQVVPECWVTTPDGEPFSALEQAAARWKGAGVAHALAPVTWEGRPGSLEGATPGYPKDMRNVASQLRLEGYRPGITVDPLAVQGGDADWTAVSEDGQRWVNPGTAEGMKHGVAQMAKVAAWGFEFYVVAPSHIPAEVLRHFNLTRAQANTMAFDMMVQAAGGAPVVGASKTTLGATLDDWLLAAASTSRLHEYSAALGPVRFDASKVDTLGDDVTTAMSFFGGPIELVGEPSPGVLGQVGRVFPKPDMWPRALDAANASPKLWQVQVQKRNGAGESLAIVSFPGARESTPDELKSPSGETLKTWKGDAANFLQMIRKPVPDANRVSRREIWKGNHDPCSTGPYRNV